MVPYDKAFLMKAPRIGALLTSVYGGAKWSNAHRTLLECAEQMQTEKDPARLSDLIRRSVNAIHDIAKLTTEAGQRYQALDRAD